MNGKWPISANTVSTLAKVGRDIRDARRRRRLTMALVAERGMISRATLSRIERGDPGVGIGSYAMVLHALGMLSMLRDAFDLSRDAVGQALNRDQLPKRVRMR